MKQVKSKQRVADYGEVFTNEREVKAMVDLVWEQFADRKKIEATYLEPACGSGNFLVEILNTRPRKRFGFLSPKQVYLQTINNNGKVIFIS